jgi:hypothetical protein
LPFWLVYPIKGSIVSTSMLLSRVDFNTVGIFLMMKVRAQEVSLM